MPEGGGCAPRQGTRGAVVTQQTNPPLYVAAYDVEADPEVSVPATRAVAAVHRRHRAPATFFIVTRLLETAKEEFRAILDDELFDIQSHTHTHARLKELVASNEREALQREIATLRDEVKQMENNEM